MPLSRVTYKSACSLYQRYIILLVQIGQVLRILIIQVWADRENEGRMERNRILVPVVFLVDPANVVGPALNRAQYSKGNPLNHIGST